MPTDFVDVSFLYTFAGVLVVLSALVQFTKGIIKDRFCDGAVRGYTLVLAFGLMLLAYWGQGLFDATAREIWMALALALINAVMVTLAALGGYEALSDPGATKKKL